MKPSAIFACAICLSACGVARPVLESDNTKVEVKTVVERVVDTAYVELPVIVERVATIDTTSTLENTYAKSEAIVAAGILHHSLETKPVSVPVKIETKEIMRDSIIFRDRIQTQTVEVEKKLTAWQRTKMKTGEVTMGVCLLSLIILITYFILNLLKLKRL